MPEQYFSVKISGFKELDARLKALPRKVSKKIIKDGVRAGGKMVADMVKYYAPVGKTGKLKKAISILTPRKQFRGSYAVFVGFKKSKLQELYNLSGPKDAHGFYPAYVEYGTDQQPANPFMRRGFDSIKHRAAKVTETIIRNGIERAARGGSG